MVIAAGLKTVAELLLSTQIAKVKACIGVEVQDLRTRLVFKELLRVRWVGLLTVPRLGPSH